MKASIKAYLSVLIFLISLTNGHAQFQLDDKGAISNLKVMELSSGETMLRHNPELRLIPASLTKVITTATALELLGPEFTYSTSFYCLGKIKKGKLLGHLLIKSSGDPTLGSKYFDQTDPEQLYARVAEELKTAGIESIAGTVVIESETIHYAASRLWEDMGNYYGASPQGFNWRDNTAAITLRSAEIGSTAEVISVQPQISPYSVRSHVIAAGHNNDSAYVYGVNNFKEWWIEGSIPENRSAFTIKAALPHPAQTFKNGLETYLQRKGIRIKHDAQLDRTSEQIADQTILFTYHSPTLAEIIKNINHVSNNLFADQLLLTLGKIYKGAPSWDNGNKVVEEFWSGKIGFKDNFRLRDGSGLTPKNLVSADGMVQLLTWMQQNSANYEVYAQSLAKGGESGTLRNMFKHPDLMGRVIGKSGSLEGVLGYCGYLTTVSGKKAAFCVIANNYLNSAKQIRKSMDKVITDLILEE